MNLAFLGAPGLGAPELILIVFVLVLLFGAKKLPEMARGSGRALRIFKAETKAMKDDKDEPAATPSGQITAVEQQPVVAPAPNAQAPIIAPVTTQQSTDAAGNAVPRTDT